MLLRSLLRKASAIWGRWLGRWCRTVVKPASSLGAGFLASYDRLSLARPVRAIRSRTFLSRRTKLVSCDALLVGWDAGVPPSVESRQTGEVLRWSVPVERSPHADLLREFANRPEALNHRDFHSTPYAQHARRVIDLSGSYFGATDMDGIVDVARAVVDRFSGRAHLPLPQQSKTGSDVRVRRVMGTDLYQIVDGHHRAAIAAVQDEDLEVAVGLLPCRTPLQRYLRAMSWLSGRAELYQPIGMPDVAGWTLVRRCEDRLQMMLSFLEGQDVQPETSRYLDVGCCYGWFLGQFLKLGAEVRGIELDELAPRLAKQLYDVPESAVQTGDAVEVLAREGTYGVVSCFSLAHHYVLGRSRYTAEELLRALDNATSDVLFFDMGQGTERWFGDTMRGWDPFFIAEWIQSSTSFDLITPLGVDADGTGEFAGNYGRTIFACQRS